MTANHSPLPVDETINHIPKYEHWLKASEIIAGLQPDAVDAIETVAEKRITDMTILQLVMFIEENHRELNPFWK